MNTYKWGDPRATLHFVDRSIRPQVVGEHLETLRAQLGGTFTRVDVLDSARPKQSPIHGLFEWNDKDAAERYRVFQAGQLVRAVTIVREDPASQQAVVVRAFVTLEEEEGDDEDHGRSTGRRGKRWTSIDDALGDPVQRAALLQRAMRELHGWRKRYEQLEEFARLFQVADEIEREQFPIEQSQASA